MNEEYIKGLRKALNLSPENNPLRLLLADALIFGIIAYGWVANAFIIK